MGRILFVLFASRISEFKFLVRQRTFSAKLFDRRCSPVASARTW